MSKEDFATPEEERDARQLLARPIDWITIPAGATEIGVIKWIRDRFGVNDARALMWWKAARASGLVSYTNTKVPRTILPALGVADPDPRYDELVRISELEDWLKREYGQELKHRQQVPQPAEPRPAEPPPQGVPAPLSKRKVEDEELLAAMHAGYAAGWSNVGDLFDYVRKQLGVRGLRARVRALAKNSEFDESRGERGVKKGR
jgi:hypothetical protein